MALKESTLEEGQLGGPTRVAPEDLIVQAILIKINEPEGRRYRWLNRLAMTQVPLLLHPCWQERTARRGAMPRQDARTLKLPWLEPTPFRDHVAYSCKVARYNMSKACVVGC